MTGPGEIIASAVVKQILTKLGDLAIKEAILQWGFKEDMADMEEKMKDMQAVLNDVDGWHYGGQEGEAARRWVTKFKSVAYDTEDVLDEFEANIKRQPCLKRITMPHKLKKLRKKIDKLANEKPVVNPRRQEVQPEGRRNNETFAPTTVRMIGRDKEKETIVSLLLKFEAEAAISIVPIVGLGGVGKTTLARAVYQDSRVEIFDTKAWVDVSNKFDLLEIGKAIIKKVNSNINFDSACHNLQFVHDSLQANLRNKRYLIVLDNLWEEDINNLEILKEMLQHGCKGSKIIVTTRNSSVVEKLSTGVLANERIICPMPKPQQINLDGLVTDDCWELMRQRAFGPYDEQSSLLVEIGKEIAAKCRGLPLVANALGQVMSELKTTQAWQQIRDKKIVLDSNDSHEKATLESLMLSYYYMKLDYKHCFTYLAAIPKGFILDTNHLTQQWIALGYIKDTVSGQRCINYLLGMSFLLASKSTTIIPVQAESPLKITMHDLVHDLVTIISAGESLTFDATEPKTWKAATEAKRYCRHAQVINYHKQSSVLNDLPSKLRSLHFRERTETLLPRKAFSRSKYLRVLDLSGCSSKEQPSPADKVLPWSIHGLKLLKYLNVSGLPIAMLTKSIHQLCLKEKKSIHQLQNMQTLIISDCCLESLPCNIGSLHKLCYLDLSRNRSLSELPASLGDLLELFFLNISGCSKLHGLPESVGKLTSLRYLDMSECLALERLPESLGSLTNLSFLNLSSCIRLTKLPASLKLESLQHLNLSDCYNLENLPQDLSYLQKLELLSLSECHKVRMLPDSFIQLRHLKILDLSDCHNLKELPKQFGNISELHSLILTSCPMLETLPESVCNMSKLKHLSLSYCIRLEKLPSFSTMNIQTLEISGCYHLKNLPDGIDNMTSLIRLDMHTGRPNVLEKAENIKARLKLPPRTLLAVDEGLHSLTAAALKDYCESSGKNLCLAEPDGKLRDNPGILDLFVIWSGEEKNRVTSEELIPPRTVWNFSLSQYESKDFPNWMLDISSYVPNLTDINLFDLTACESLPPLGQLPNLRILSLHNIPNIKKIGNEFYGYEGKTKKLRVIILELMENLEEWWITRSGDEDGELLMPNLHMLEVTDCPKLKFLPYPPRSTISWFLTNSAEVLPRSGFERLSASTLPCWATIKNCDLTLDQWDRLQNLTTLEHLEVINCGGLRPLQDSEDISCLASLRYIQIESCEELDLVPGCIGQLVQLRELVIRDCPKVRYLPDGFKNLRSLEVLRLSECSGLDVLPEWLGQLTSLEHIVLWYMPNLKSLPDSMKNLRNLKKLWLFGCEALTNSLEVIGHLTSLKLIYLGVPSLTFLPESMKSLTVLEELYLHNCNIEMLPEWMGKLASLKELYILNCQSMTCLPESIRNLRSLETLYVWGCPRLVLSCQRDGSTKISHIPKVKFEPIDSCNSHSVKNINSLHPALQPL